MQHLLRNSWGRVTLEHTIENIVDTEKEYGYFIIPNSIIHYDWNYGGSGSYIPGFFDIFYFTSPQNKALEELEI
jgi:hypothetical protein